MGSNVENDSFDELGALPLREGGGAKHSPPGHQGAPDCPWPHPPVRVADTPLTNDISGSSPSNELFSILIRIVFGAPSDGINPIS